MTDSHSNYLVGFAKLIVLLPYRVTAAVIGGLAWLLSYLPLSMVSAHRDIVISCLASFPEKNYSDIRKLARRSLVETSRTLIRFPYIWQQAPEISLRKVNRVHGRAQVEAAMAGDKPVLLLSLHQSCWELQAIEMGRLGKVLILYKPGSPIDSVAKAGREATGCVTVPATGKGVFASMSELKKGGALCLLVDHPPTNLHNPCVEFFSHEVMVPGLVYKVVDEFSPVMFYISTQRVGPEAFDIYYEPAVRLVGQKTQKEFLTQLMSDLQRIILKAPEQYNWAYNRYRRGADGKRFWYKRRNAMAIIRGAANCEDVQQLLKKYEKPLK